MKSSGRCAMLVLALGGASLLAQQKPQTFTVGPRTMVNVSNQYGSVTVRPGSGHDVIVSGRVPSDKVKITGANSGNRLEIRVESAERLDRNSGAVDLDVQVPTDASVTVRTSTASVKIERMKSDVSVESDSGLVEVNGSANAHVHVQTVDGPVRLANITNGHIEVTTIGGDVSLDTVSGHTVAIKTTRGKITYIGDFADNGRYTFTSHSGAIEVALPENASVDLTANSLRGEVQNQTSISGAAVPSQLKQGKSFSGMMNKGGSSVELRSFTGNIIVRKR